MFRNANHLKMFGPMISHRHRCIFIHNRKAAGLSVREAFGFDKRDPDWHRYNNGVRSIEWYFRPRGYLIFAIVRNPFDRLISAWQYLAKTRAKPLAEVLRDPPHRGHDYFHLTRQQSAILTDFSSGDDENPDVFYLELEGAGRRKNVTVYDSTNEEIFKELIDLIAQAGRLEIKRK